MPVTSPMPWCAWPSGPAVTPRLRTRPSCGGAERWLQLDVEPSLNHLVAAGPALAEATGYHYGLLHFIVTPLVLGWLYLRRPSAFPRLRSALVLATGAANIVFWTWPVAPPRYSVPGMTDILVSHHVLGAADPHGPGRLVNLYAAMPSLHVAWATWCAAAVIAATRSRRRHLAWLYPTATVLVVLASANHFLLDAAGGLAVLGLGLLGTAGKQRRPCDGHRGVGSRPDPAGRGAPPMSTVTITGRPAAGAGPAGAPRTAFVLAGGAALGAMQAGMVHALHERGITPTCWPAPRPGP